VITCARFCLPLIVQDGEGASSAAAAQRLVMMGGQLAWQLRCWVAELGTSGGYNTLMEVGQVQVIRGECHALLVACNNT
jgi:hypothetical protein